MTKENLLVICDTLDLPVGKARIKRSGSSAGHGGLKSIISRIGTDVFARCYIGIGRPTGASIIEYVLATPSQSDTADIDRCIAHACDAIEVISRDGFETGLQQFNTACS